MYRTLGVLLVVLIVLTGCAEDRRISAEIEEIPVEIVIERFDQAFAGAKPGDLQDLKSRYPYFFPPQYPDSIWLAKMEDSLQNELEAEVENSFPDLEEIREQLELFYKHVLYYFPQEKVPRVVTMTSDVDYRNRIILTDSLLLIGLDNYLGADHRFYQGIDRYIASDLDRQYLISDVAGAFSKKVNPYPGDRSFLAQMIYYGRELYLKDRLLPLLTDAQKIGYTDEQLEWAGDNEEQIWRYFIERELIYSTDSELGPRFLDPAPFSKFRLELDNESPGQLGRFMGWQIVRAFMSGGQFNLSQMLQLPADELFRRSNYKPKK